MTLLSVNELTKTYRGSDGSIVQALSEASFELQRGEVLGVVGESGCGKSTLGRALLRLVEPDSGRVEFDGTDITALGARKLKAARRDMQIVFQDPYGSLNPRHSVAAIVGEPLDVHRVGTRATRRARIAELLDMVGLPAAALSRLPHEFSGGQRQRIAIARALALGPRLLIADEAVSALDVSIQSQIINLIADLQQQLSLTMLFIGHDLSVVRHVSDRIAVMYLGRIVEIGDTAAIMDTPHHPYTRALISAIPSLDAAPGGRIVLEGDLPDPAHPPPGCAFATRCTYMMDICRTTRPLLRQRRVAADGATVDTACHLYEPAP